jgi:hypothetical protein
MSRLKLLRRVALLREVEHRATARAAAEAETARGEIAALAERTLRLAQDYAVAGGASDGGTLVARARFAGTLRTIHATAQADHQRAGTLADTRMAALAEAERRRDAVHERVEHERRAERRAGREPILGGRRPAPLEERP